MLVQHEFLDSRGLLEIGIWATSKAKSSLMAEIFVIQLIDERKWRNIIVCSDSQ